MKNYPVIICFIGFLFLFIFQKNYASEQEKDIQEMCELIPTQTHLKDACMSGSMNEILVIIRQHDSALISSMR
jgi:hypothetical protein